MGADVTRAWAIFVKNGWRLDNPTGAQVETWVVERNSGDRFEMILDRNACTKLKWWRFHMIFFGNPRSLALSPIAKTKFWRLLPLALLQPPWEFGGLKVIFMAFPPRNRQTWEFPEGWGGGEVDQSWPVHLQNLGMTKWCCKMKAISRQFIATELPPGFPGIPPKGSAS